MPGIFTKSQFYYGHEVTDQNNLLPFIEDGVDLIATLLIGRYSLSDYAVEVARALTESGTQDYSGTVDRTTGQITITTDGVLLFSFPIATTTVGNLAFGLMGFTGPDTLPALFQVGNERSGRIYRPQFLLQDFVGSDEFIEANQASINESSDGTSVEVVKFGDRRFTEFEIRFITDERQGKGGPIEDNPTGRADYLDFANEIIQKGNIEFMADREDPATFETFLLDKTESNGQGVGFRLRLDLVEKYFRSGKLTFRTIV